MSNMRMKHKLIMSMMAGAIIIPGSVVRTQAAESGDSEKSLVPVTGIENILEASYQTEIKNNINLYLVPTEEGEYLNIEFYNKSRIIRSIFRFWNINKIRKTTSCRKFPNRLKIILYRT